MFILRHRRARWLATVTLLTAAVSATLAITGVATGEPAWYGAAAAIGVGWLLVANLALLWAFVRLQMTHNAHVEELRASSGGGASVADARRAAIAEVERVDALIQARIDVESESTAATVAGLHDDVAQLRHEVDEIDAADRTAADRMVDLRNEVADQRAASHAGLEELRRLVAAASAVDEVADVRSDVAALRRQVRDVERRVKSERSDRIVAMARRAVVERPGRLLLIVAPPRTGSTWLFDGLRAHPAVQVMPTTEMLQELGLVRMNRYPSGLSDGADATLELEVSPGAGARIPEFRIAAPPAAAELARYAIEKIHPLFFDDDTDRFLAGVEAFQQDTGIAVSVLYRLRSPRMAVRSALRYQRRDPDWYRFVEADAMPLHFLRALTALDVLAAKLPGPASVYEDHRAHGAEHLAGIFGRLWPDAPAALHYQVAQEAEQATSRGRRAETAFLGAKTSDEDAQNAEIETIVNRHAAVLDECVEVHERLLGRLRTG